MTNNRIRSVIVIALLILCAGGAWILYEKSKGQIRIYPGYAEGELVYVSSPVSGALKNLTVNRGDWVEAGKVLFELEREQERASKDQATEMLSDSRVRLEHAKNDYVRQKTLLDDKVSSPQDYDAALQTYLSADHAMAAQQHTLEVANWQFDQKIQSAPEAGLIYDTYYRPGEWVPAGQPILSLLPPEYIKVRFFVPESDLGKLQIGTPLSISSDGLTGTLSARVSFVSPQAEYTEPIIYSRENRNKLVFLVEGSLAPKDAVKLHPGTPIEVILTSHH